METNQLPLGEATLAQVAFVVRDIEAAAQKWADLLGQPVPNIITTAPGNDVAQTYRGVPSNAQAKLAFLKLGPVQLELIEPIGEDSAWYEGLARHGEGFHHLAFWVENLPEKAALLKDKGIAMSHRGDMGPGQFAYFDAEGNLNTTLELLERERTDGRAEG